MTQVVSSYLVEKAVYEYLLSVPQQDYWELLRHLKLDSDEVRPVILEMLDSGLVELRENPNRSSKGLEDSLLALSV